MCALSLALCANASTCFAQAADLIVIRTSDKAGSRELRCTVTEYTGTELRFRTSSGRDESIAAAQVLSVATLKTTNHTEAEKLYEVGDFSKALGLYRVAIREETRRWMRRQILAQMVVCFRNTQQYEAAGDTFRLIYQDDSTTQYFDVIPLSWRTAQPSTSLQQRALSWLELDDNPAAQLVGASWLMSTQHRAKCQQVLNKLAAAKDSRVAMLAEAQGWRTEIVTADLEKVKVWQERVRRLAPRLQVGPQFVIGQGLLRNKQYATAALAFMRAPILNPNDIELASNGLLAAGQALEGTQQIGQAIRIYQEVIADYRTSLAADEATLRLEGLSSPNE
ncbi:MAG: tetratricopeptide (TPR) repeat protein [Pirellulaceae bacterium]|jgi:tetratricopeptide (TPR) repeat protein